MKKNKSTKIINAEKVVLIVIMLVVALNSKSQTSFIWGKQFGTSDEEYVRNFVIDQSGCVYVSGNTKGVMNDENFGKTDGFIIKVDSLGNTIWSRQFGSKEDEDIQFSAIDSEGAVYITGSTRGNLGFSNVGKEDVFIVKYSNEGEEIWTKQFGTDNTDIALGIFIDKKGYLYITGETLGKLGENSFGGQDAFIMKLDNNGKQLYIKQFGTGERDACSSITGDNKGNIYVAGSTFGDIETKNKGLMDGFIGKFTDKGDSVNFIQLGSDGFDIFTCILVDQESNIYVGGTTAGDFGSHQLGNGDCFILKMNPQGKLLWNNQFGTNKHDGVKAIALNPRATNNILISGLLSLPPACAFIRMYDTDGLLLWEKNITENGDTKDSSGKYVTIDNDGIIYNIGLTMSSLYSPLIGLMDAYIVKFKLANDFLTH